MIRRIALFALLYAAAVPPVAAGDVPLPPLTPKGQFLVMTQDDATSSSKCIGDPKTPMCAVETEIAAEVRGNLDLERIAMALEGGRLFNEMYDRPGPAIIYRVMRSEVLTDRSFPWPPKSDLNWRPGGLIMQAGDIRIDIAQVNCYREISLAACEHFWGPRMTYIVRRQGDRWFVVSFKEPYDLRR